MFKSNKVLLIFFFNFKLVPDSINSGTSNYYLRSGTQNVIILLGLHFKVINSFRSRTLRYCWVQICLQVQNIGYTFVLNLPCDRCEENSYTSHHSMKRHSLHLLTHGVDRRTVCHAGPAMRPQLGKIQWAQIKSRRSFGYQLQRSKTHGGEKIKLRCTN